MSDNLLWILQWYYNQCDGDWEHCYGVKIGTLDNPGWYLKVSLNETEMQHRKFDIVDINRSKNDWLYCSVEDSLFAGYGGPSNLVDILKVFEEWVTSIRSNT